MATANYRDTLNLPTTAFPMRADLPKREPARVDWWAQERVYQRRLEKNKHAGSPWILHDGPPYSNGELHMGTFLNRVLKDAFVKINLLDGRWADFVPGWDMHGLPIELETLKHLGLDFHKVDPVELREKCRERALYWLGIQRDTILRMGCFGHFDRPYRTIDPEYEATIVEALADLARAGQLYKGLRATLWCVHDETALAEAEIEYHDHRSPSIYVRFSANEEQRADIFRRFKAPDDGNPVSFVIWTTTPWTLPANQAIAVKPDAAYAMIRFNDEWLIVADRLVTHVLAQFAHPLQDKFDAKFVAQGKELEGLRVRHPFMNRDSLVVEADYVELDTGTGAVHTAPGHGADDFETGAKYGLEILNPVDHAGRFTEAAGPYAGTYIFDANEKIIDDLRASGALISADDYIHSYPHCWRCKNPVIFRATAQWFLSLDRNGLRARILEKIPGVRFFPGWGQSRMAQMIENHPEWCLSRQRTWGTPIPAVVCQKCQTSILDPDVALLVAARFRKEGANIWWTDDVATFLPPGFTCPHCQGTTFVKEMNIVDIWFESGVSNRAVLGKDGLPWPADAYLEGSDQYRGWFRSNLVTAVATKDAPPYRSVISTGWVVDEDGRAMHKSAGNYIGAQEGIDRYGADVLRLWVASVEFTADVRLGRGLLENIGNVYRNFRNRMRFLISVLGDLPLAAVLPRDRMAPYDRLALAALDATSRDVVEHYRNFRLHDAYLALVSFDDDLSRFYLDALKDPLYSGEPDGHRRRSAQSAILEILRTLAVLLAPILSFTAEEAWQFVPESLRGEHRSIFDVPFPRVGALDEIALEEWNVLKALRAQVAANDSPRDFEADATVLVDKHLYERLVALGDNLREALIVSHVVELDHAPDGVTGVTLQPAHGSKCARCWKFRELGSDAEHPEICADCAHTVRGLARVS
jgi:isoleucyl-tRNA synthetase